MQKSKSQQQKVEQKVLDVIAQVQWTYIESVHA